MARLHVRPPDTLTRVTEYIPEIIQFVQKIIDNGYAYESEGSVYFDTETYDGSNGHVYAKLQPGSKGSKELLEDGEGLLIIRSGTLRTINEYAMFRRSTDCSSCWPTLKNRLRSMETIETERTIMAFTVGPWPARLAYRMLRHGKRDTW